ncbi:MAG: DMT family transporter [Ectothiorhodospiraceae bacterium]|nr:DMT family transporter [Chromatiales bacterium]MCP5154638.1 DMT family transporter [Ectothiorhodospiraceae bacterium]
MAPPRGATSGIALMLLGVAVYAWMDGLVKWLSATYPTIQLVLFRCVFGFVPVAVVVLRGRSLGALRTTRPLAHLVRSMATLGALWGFFVAFAHMPLADAYAIGFAAPLLITALSVPMLGERVGVRRWSAVVAGFVGVLIMLRPGAGVMEPAALIALGATVCYALTMIFIRQLSRTETDAAIVFYPMLAIAAVSAALVPPVWVAPGALDLALLAAVGVLGGIGQLLLTAAFRRAEVALLTPFEYSAMLWATGIGWLVWGDVPGLHIWVGVAIVAASGIYVVLREARVRDEVTVAPVRGAGAVGPVEPP